MTMILELFKLLGLRNCWQYLVDIPNFYLFPIKSFRDFFHKSTQIKVAQTTFYLIIYILLLYILAENVPIIKIIKVIVITLFTVLFPFLFFILNGWLIRKTFKIKIKSINSYLLIVIINVLSTPLLLLPYLFFVWTENFDFYFIFNLLFCILILILWFIPGLIYYKHLKPRILYCIFSYINLNISSFLVFAVIYLFLLNAPNDILENLDANKISKEYYQATENFIQPYELGINKFVITNRGNKYYYLVDENMFKKVSDRNNSLQISLAEIKFQSDSLQAIIKNSEKSLDSIIPKIKYKSVKSILSTERKLFAEINNELEPRSLESEVFGNIYSFNIGGDTSRYTLYTCIYTESTMNKYRNYQQQIIKFQKQVLFSEKPIEWFSKLLFVSYFNWP